jgi:uncharacterized protein (DUF1501 family)
MSKILVCVDLGGGMDAFNFMSARDSASVSEIQTARALAASNILTYTNAVTKSGTLTKDSNVITGLADVTSLAVGQLVYSPNLPAQRRLKISAVGANTVTLTGNAFSTATETISFGDVTYSGTYLGNLQIDAKNTQQFKINESVASGRDPAFHPALPFLSDVINVPDNAGNASKVKGLVISNIGPLRRKTYKSGTNGGIFNLDVDAIGNGVITAANSQQYPAQLTSHNDQTTTWHSNAPEGATKGWGGGIADQILAGLSGPNPQIASVSASGRPAFSAGSTAKVFNVSSSGLIRKMPDGAGNFTAESGGVQTALKALFIQATTTNPLTSDFTESFTPTAQQGNDFQNIMGNVINLTDPPAIAYNIVGSMAFNASTWASGMKTLARMILANNPNRGATMSRAAASNVATITTQVTTGVANRTAGSAVMTITSNGHGLFTSGTSTSDLSDSVLVTTTGATIDAAPPANGYKITLVEGNEDNAFTLTGTDTTALVNVPVNIQLKHNLTVLNKVYLTATGLDSSSPTTGYQVVSVPNTTSFTINTTATTLLSNVATKFKLINLDRQVLYTGSPNVAWDSHTFANHSNLGCLNDVLSYFNSIVSRIQDADVVTFTISEFGRTFTSNNAGTDHAWGGHQFVFGKSVRGNKIYGNIPSYSATGPDLAGNILVPSTSVYQYGATFARWMGLSDAQILTLFPDLQYWPANERYLSFLDALV